jgi:sporulation protein YlmC with PRC-barrel domain
MRFTESMKRPVLDTSTAEQVGQVAGFVVDPRARRVHAVRVGRHKGGSILPWADVQGYGPDAVTVASAAAIREPGDGLDEADDLIGRRVVSDQGFELGAVDDIEFDPDTGELQQIDVGGRAVTAGMLIGAGRYAVVLRHPDDAPRR